MKPVIALVGRPNVGKSTLFNRLTRTRDAIVADQPGMTRDRKYGHAKIDEREVIVIDTGGLSGEREGIDVHMAGQTLLAIEEADLILFLVDARDGLTTADETIAAQLRQLGKPLVLVLNKIDGINADMAIAEFHALGLGEPLPIASAHGRGVQRMVEAISGLLPAPSETGQEDEANLKGIRIAVLGRPNVGKSTLVNRMLGEERVLVYDMPGTTRDSIFIPFERMGKEYTLIDTAGVRRRGKIREVVEKFSVVKTLQAIDAANVVILVLDARLNISDQDLSLLGQVLDAGRALVIAVNKWDNLSQDDRNEVKRELDRRLNFIDFADIHFISALHGTGVGNLFDSVDKAYESAMRKISTPQLTRILEDALEAHQPPLVRGRRIKLRYAHQGGQNPPIIVIHGNQTEAVPNSYKRYLMNTFMKVLGFRGTPVRIEFRTGVNPFQGRRNKLTPRQQRSRKRMMKHVKK
ncbi:MAG: ribosome biogenesis GTPase Der [Granulosicoccaceae bacterium]|jgi:GTP-binding protein